MTKVPLETMHERVEAKLRWEFEDWIAKHPQAGAFDWSVATTNVLAPLGLDDLDAAVERAGEALRFEQGSRLDFARAALEAALTATDSTGGSDG